MRSTLRQVRSVLVPRAAGPYGPLPPLLVVLTVVSGLVDAFSFLVLGRVFVANVTGNVVFLAFALAGAHGFSALASALALLAFLAGATAGGRLRTLLPAHRARLLLAGTGTQLVLVLVALVLGETFALPPIGARRAVLVGLLGLAMGVQNSVVHRLAVPDLTATTVLTTTLTGFAAESRAGGGPGTRTGRRLVSAVSLFAGALLGAALVAHGHPRVLVPVVACLLLAVSATLLPQCSSTRPWTAPRA